MALRPGRNEGADKLFTYVALGLVGVGVVAGFFFLRNQQVIDVGMMSETTLLEEGVSIEPGGALRYDNLKIDAKGKTVIKYQLEVDCTRSELHAGLVYPGTSLQPANTVWTQGGSGGGIVRGISGRPRHVKETVQAGKYDVLIENRSQAPAAGKVTLKAIYEPIR